MIECPGCGGYNTAGTVEYDDDGNVLYTEWRCGDCGAEWIEDSANRGTRSQLLPAEAGSLSLALRR